MEVTGYSRLAAALAARAVPVTSLRLRANENHAADGEAEAAPCNSEPLTALF